MSQLLDVIGQLFEAGNVSKIERTSFGLGLFGNALVGDAEGIGQRCLNSTSPSGSDQISPHRLTGWSLSNILADDAPSTSQRCGASPPLSYLSQPSPWKGSVPSCWRTWGKSTLTQLSTILPSTTFQKSI